MNQIDMYLDRNRELLSCNGSACPSPGVGSPRMQRTKARLVDLSSTTHHPTTSPKQPRLRHLGYGSDIDGVSTKSEQMSTCSDDGDFHTRSDLDLHLALCNSHSLSLVWRTLATMLCMTA